MSEARITLADVDHIARLARLDLSAEERDRMRGQLDAILGYVGQLQQVDTTGVPPTAHVLPLANVMREDEIRPSYPPAAMLANAPEADGDLFRVPKILED
jgi:aspartyl-tRNA(Asn)/glutamyl-tRNA(Gln) amidotransferase subunit C